MTEALRHRGPDDEGYFLFDSRSGRGRSAAGSDTVPSLELPPLEACGGGWDLALGFRRLAILDLSPAGHQPMTSADGSRVLVFNGEIYNYRELREEMEQKGRRFRGGGDTEVLLALLEEEGAACLPRLVGMFAFAFLDMRARTLLLARDFFGIKPLYYTLIRGALSFASEIKALRRVPGFEARAEPERVLAYLADGVTDDGDGTLLAGVKQVPAAHFIEWKLDGELAGVQPRSYWRPESGPKRAWQGDEAAEAFRALFLRSVELHLRSDVQVGSALSGGIDSSSIVMAMRRLEPALPIHTFSYFSSDASRNEESWAGLVNGAAGAVPHPVRIPEAGTVDDVLGLVDRQDEPFGSLSILAQGRVFAAARDAGVKVMLDGQGADELFAGYPNFRLSALAGSLSTGQWGRAARLALSIRSDRTAPARQLFGAFKRRFQADRDGGTAPREFPGWLEGAWFRRRGVSGAGYRSPFRADSLSVELHRSLTRTSLPMLLRYEDRNSMAVSIESRVPFLEPRLAEFAAALPDPLRIGDDGLSKRVVRAGMRGIVPGAILERRDKIGFETPDAAWLRGQAAWVDSIFRGETARRIPLWRAAAVEEGWQAVRDGRAERDPRLWRWINFALWAERTGMAFD